jgi:hypothetical protein
LSPETPIPNMPTGCHLSQLDRTTQTCLEIWELYHALNLGQCDSPENPMTVDLLCRWILAAVNKTSLTRLTCNWKRDSPMPRLGAPRATCKPGYFCALRQKLLLTQPLAPIEIALHYTSSPTNSSHTLTKEDHETRFFKWIQPLQKQVHDIPQQDNSKYKKDNFFSKETTHQGLDSTKSTPSPMGT